MTTVISSHLKDSLEALHRRDLVEPVLPQGLAGPLDLFDAGREGADSRVHRLSERALGVRDGVPRVRQVEEHRVRRVLQPEPIGAYVPARGRHAVPQTVRLELLPRTNNYMIVINDSSMFS